MYAACALVNYAEGLGITSANVIFEGGDVPSCKGHGDVVGEVKVLMLIFVALLS